MTTLFESPSRIEPCLLENVPVAIMDNIANLTTASERLGHRLHPKTASSLADLVRVMNCYYSNLIEGHHTKPIDIERALLGDLDNEGQPRSLQVEALAHIRVQRMIDHLYVDGSLPEPASINFIHELHRAFYDDVPESMLLIEGANHSFRMKPGAFRTESQHDVAVGRHIPPSSCQVEAFMQYFEQRYQFESLGKASRIVAMASAHHRFNYIHPFPDGNGRVSRLMSHAMGLAAGIGAFGLWSVSRGLARGIDNRQKYKQMMSHADMPRQGDLDGRGNLSQKALIDFVDWFLMVCVDQVNFMSGLFEFDYLANRLKLYVERQQLKPEAFYLLERVLQQGEMPRGDAERVTGLKERSARTVLSSLIAQGILGSDTPKGAVSLRFPSRVADLLFPLLFPES